MNEVTSLWNEEIQGFRREVVEVWSVKKGVWMSKSVCPSPFRIVYVFLTFLAFHISLRSDFTWLFVPPKHDTHSLLAFNKLFYLLKWFSTHSVSEESLSIFQNIVQVSLPRRSLPTIPKQDESLSVLCCLYHLCYALDLAHLYSYSHLSFQYFISIYQTYFT